MIHTIYTNAYKYISISTYAYKYHEYRPQAGGLALSQLPLLATGRAADPGHGPGSQNQRTFKICTECSADTCLCCLILAKRGSSYVLVCVVQVFGVDYEMIEANTSKFINTYHTIQYIDTMFLYIPILVNTY